MEIKGIGFLQARCSLCQLAVWNHWPKPAVRPHLFCIYHCTPKGRVTGPYYCSLLTTTRRNKQSQNFDEKATSQGVLPPKVSLHSCNKWFRWPTRVHIPNVLSISSAILAQLMVMSDRQTDRQTNKWTTAHQATFLHSMHALWPKKCTSPEYASAATEQHPAVQHRHMLQAGLPSSSLQQLHTTDRHHLRCSKSGVAWWHNGKGAGLATQRLQVWLPAGLFSGNNLGQVVCTHVPLLPSRKICYQSNESYTLWLEK